MASNSRRDPSALAAAAALPPAAWGPSHSKYGGKIRGGAITAGCGDTRWATGAGTLPEQGKYRIQYRVDRIASGNITDILVGVASRAARVEDQSGGSPKGCYCWWSYESGRGSKLYADGSCVQDNIPQESHAGSTIEVIVDQDASTVEFRLDGAPVGKGGTACKLAVKPEHKRDLTPAASVRNAGSALTLVAVEAVAR